MKNKKLMALLLTASLVITTALVGCGKKTTTTNNEKETKEEVKEEKRENEITLQTGAIKTLDSNLATDSESFGALFDACEGLTRYDYANSKVCPGMAESWESSEDGLTWTFHLRDAKWSDGKAVTADDFVYSWIRLITPATKASYSFMLTDAIPIKNSSEYYAGKAKAEDVGIKAVDEKTFQVTLAAPTPYFLNTTSFPGLYPLRKDIVEAQGEKYGTDISKMVFNGPYVISNWQKGSKIQFEKNEKYWDIDTVSIQKVTFLKIDEISTRFQMFMNDDLDQMGGSRDYLEKLKASAEKGEIQYTQGVDTSVFYFLFNMKKNPVFKSAKVRLALSLAIDRAAYTDKILKRCIPAYSFIPSSIVCVDKPYRESAPEQLKDVDTDPKELFMEGLKEVGITDPSKVTIHYLSQGSDSTDRADAEFFQNQWQTKLGCKVIIDAAADFSDFLKKEDNGEFEIGFNGWGADYNDPYTFIGIFLKDGGNNTGKYYNEKFEKLATQLARETDTDKRIELTKQCEEILVKEDPAFMPLYYSDFQTFRKNYVKGVQTPSFGGNYELKWASIEGAE